MATVILIGSDGWVVVEIEDAERGAGINKGTNFSMNLSAIQAISAPFNWAWRTRTDPSRAAGCDGIRKAQRGCLRAGS